jgi:hypothetical protein
MAGTYQAFAVFKQTTAGEQTSVGAGVQVKVRLAGAGSDAAESPLTTNANGEIVGGTIAAGSPGQIVYFRVENLNGLAGSVAQILT